MIDVNLFIQSDKCSFIFVGCSADKGFETVNADNLLILELTILLNMFPNTESRLIGPLLDV